MYKSKWKTKRAVDFILKIFSVLEGFQFKGKRYLTYISEKRKGDEFLIRDSIIKPIFVDVLGYDKQKDFVPEESIESGTPDTQILDANNHAFIVIETLESNAKKAKFDEHRIRLFGYTKELGVRYAVLTNGIVFEVYKGMDRRVMVSLRFDEIYRRFNSGGIDAIKEEHANALLKLKFFAKERWRYKAEDIYKEPELDISVETHFQNFLEELKDRMASVKDDIDEQFQYLNTNIKSDRKKEVKQRKKLRDSLNKWQNISQSNNSYTTFKLETMYVFFNRMLLLRICEDKKIIPKRIISNGGIKDWLSFKGWTNAMQIRYDELLKIAYKTMEGIYPHLFREDIFDWYIPNNEVLHGVLFALNFYNFNNVNKDILGRFYQEYISSDERKRLGQFYTPETVIDYILKSVGYCENSEIEGKILLDPACGSGGFLVRATNILVSRLKRKGFNSETILDKVRKSIYGFEINPFACHLAETNLLFQVIDLIRETRIANENYEFERFNIFQTDSLKIPDDRAIKIFEECNSYWLEDAEIVKKIKLKLNEFNKGFDFVVGNPPYVSYGLRGGQKMTKEEKKYLKKNYPHSAEYKISLYALFIDIGIQKLRDGGKFGYILPDSFLLGRYFSKIRKFILDTCQLLEIVVFKVDFWKSGVVGRPVILIVERDSQVISKTQLSLKARFCYAGKELQKLAFKDYEMKQNYFHRTSHNRFRLYFSEDDKKLVEILERKSELLGRDNIVSIHTGVRSKIGQKNIIGREKQSDSWKKGLISGSELDRYVIKWAGNYINIDPKRLWSGGYDANIVESEKLIMRQTGDRLCVAYDDCHYYHLNNCHSVKLVNTNYSLKYILALMNSKLINHYYNIISLELGRTMAQIDIEMIEELPIKRPDRKIEKDIVDIVDKIIENKKRILTSNEEITFQDYINTLPYVCGDLADISLKKINLHKNIGIPKIKREKDTIYIDSKSYIECNDICVAEYIEQYLLSVKGKLKGISDTMLIKMISIPKDITDIKHIMKGVKERNRNIDVLRHKNRDLDSSLDVKVCEIYGLKDSEIETILNF